MSTTTKLAGLNLKNPLLPGSGPLTGDADRMLYLAGLGLGAIVTKTIAPKGAIVSRPCIAYAKNIIMNCEAWSEYSSELWINDFLPKVRRKSDTPLIASVGYTAEDVKTLVPQMDKYVDGYECVPLHHNNSDNYDEVGEIVKAFRSATHKPIWVKMSGNKPNPIEFARACKENGATGIVAITSLGPCMVIDIANRKPLIGLESGYSWASGPAIKPLALASVYMIKQAFPDISIIGCGGVATAEDVIEFLLAGADAVEMLSEAMMKGKETYRKIINALPGALAKYGFSSVEEVKSTRLKKVIPATEPSFPVIDLEVCNLCGICEKNCPYFAISIQDGRIVVNEEKCFGCGLCQSRCPVKAISNVLDNNKLVG